MATFDVLPPELRQWLTRAVLPWSPASAQRIWSKSIAKGLTADQAIGVLAQAEAKTLARDTVNVEPAVQTRS
ncbi:MAG: DUF6525 family protein [Rhodobacteraceae bacterium]|nr:DUF6525 family protein [Paracoccaceae bacterium]